MKRNSRITPKRRASANPNNPHKIQQHLTKPIAGLPPTIQRAIARAA